MVASSVSGAARVLLVLPPWSGPERTARRGRLQKQRSQLISLAGKRGWERQLKNCSRSSDIISCWGEADLQPWSRWTGTDFPCRNRQKQQQPWPGSWRRSEPPLWPIGLHKETGLNNCEQNLFRQTGIWTCYKPSRPKSANVPFLVISWRKKRSQYSIIYEKTWAATETGPLQLGTPTVQVGIDLMWCVSEHLCVQSMCEC